MWKSFIKVKLFFIFAIFSAIFVKYLFVDDPEVHKFIKIAHLWLKLERYFIGVGYKHFNRDNIISRMEFSQKTIKLQDLNDDEILEHYDIPSLIDDYNIKIKIVANKKILSEENKYKKFPTVLYVHGGGYVFRGIETKLYKIFTDIGFIFIYVYYRLAPEYKFPTQIEDNFSVLKFISEIDILNNNLRPSRIKDLFNKINLKDLILIGESAGGNLIGSLAVLAKTRNLNYKIKITKQIFIFPGMFILGDLPSREKYRNWYLLSETEIKWFVEKYINDEKDIQNKLICPLLYEDDILRNMPDSYFIFAERDPIFSEGELYKDRLLKLENNVISRIYPAEHGFFHLEGIIPEADLAIKELKEYIESSYNKINTDI